MTPRRRGGAERGRARAATAAAGDGAWKRALVRAAGAARRNAHAPYSGFAVGAAVMDGAGRVFGGCNVENASYGLTVCAERNAVAAAVAAGARSLSAVAVVTGAPSLATPCGACRQVLAEFGGDDLRVLLARAGAAAPSDELALGALLPRAFRLRRSKP